MQVLSVLPSAHAKREAIIQVLRDAGRPMTARDIRKALVVPVKRSAMNGDLAALATAGLIVRHYNGTGQSTYELTGATPPPAAAVMRLHEYNYGRRMQTARHMDRLLEIIAAKPLQLHEIAEQSGGTHRYTRKLMRDLVNCGCAYRIRNKKTKGRGWEVAYAPTGATYPKPEGFDEYIARQFTRTPSGSQLDPEEEELTGQCYLPTADEIRIACEQIRLGWKWSGDSEATVGPPRVFRMAMSTRRKAC